MVKEREQEEDEMSANIFELFGRFFTSPSKIVHSFLQQMVLPHLKTAITALASAKTTHKTRQKTARFCPASIVIAVIIIAPPRAGITVQLAAY